MAFSTILVPVDFSINSRIAIEKAVGVAAPGGACIHLLHVAPVSMKTQKDYLDEKNAELQSLIEYGDDHEVIFDSMLICADNVQEVIASVAVELNADLLVVGKNSSSWLPYKSTVSPTLLSELTGKPVLTVTPAAAHIKPKTVVVPVGERIPYEKMNAIAALCSKLKLSVHLVAWVEGESSTAATTLLHVFKWLKQTTTCNVEYAVLDRTKKKPLLNYADSVDADIVLLYPGAEAQSGWFKKPLPDAPDVRSKLQVMSLHPQKIS